MWDANSTFRVQFRARSKYHVILTLLKVIFIWRVVCPIQFALDGVFNEGEFNNLMVRESWKNFTCGQRFAKTSLWASNFFPPANWRLSFSSGEIARCSKFSQYINRFRILCSLGAGVHFIYYVPNTCPPHLDCWSYSREDIFVNRPLLKFIWSKMWWARNLFDILYCQDLWATLLQ